MLNRRIVRLGVVGALLLPYAMVVAQGMQQLSMADLVKGRYGKYATELKLSELPDDYSAVRISTSTSPADPMYSLTPWVVYGMMGQNGSSMAKQKLLQCSWSNGDTVSLGQRVFLVTYKLDMDLSEIMPHPQNSLGVAIPDGPVHEPKLVIELVANESIVDVTPYPNLTKKDLLGAFGKPEMAANSPQDVASKKTATLSNVKQVALGMLMYFSDYDDNYPYAQGTAAVKFVTYPYVKNKKVWETYNPNGGQIVFNMGVAGANATSIQNPADTVMFYETMPWPDGRRAVAYTDGHVKLVGSDVWAEISKRLTPSGIKRVAKALPLNYGASGK